MRSPCASSARLHGIRRVQLSSGDGRKCSHQQGQTCNMHHRSPARACQAMQQALVSVPCHPVLQGLGSDIDTLMHSRGWQDMAQHLHTCVRIMHSPFRRGAASHQFLRYFSICLSSSEGELACGMATARFIDIATAAVQPFHLPEGRSAQGM